MNTLFNLLSPLAGPIIYFLIFFTLILCGFGLPLPEDIVLFAAAMLAYEQNVELMPVLFICLAGVLIGDCTIFLLGAKYGDKLKNIWPFRKFLSPERLEVVQQKLQKHGNKLIFAARFMPGLRTPIFFSSGSLRLPFRIFFFYDGIAALISVPTIILLVHKFGDEIERVVKIIKRVEHGIAITIFTIIAILALKWYLDHRKTNKNKLP